MDSCHWLDVCVSSSAVHSGFSAGATGAKTEAETEGDVVKKIVFFFFLARGVERISHEDHGRISAAAEGDLSGLTTLPLPNPYL